MYQVVATREGSWWVLDVEGMGVTQARSLSEGGTQARGLIESVTGETEVAVELEIAESSLDVELWLARDDGSTIPFDALRTKLDLD